MPGLMESVTRLLHITFPIANRHRTEPPTSPDILLANWYFKAVKKALEGNAKRKYFEHAGALLTADGTDDELITHKLEGRRRVGTDYRVQI